MIAPLFFIISLLTKPVGGAESWQAVWEKTVKAAKEEGQVTIYTSGGSSSLPHLLQPYPDPRRWSHPRDGVGRALGVLDVGALVNDEELAGLRRHAVRFLR